MRCLSAIVALLVVSVPRALEAQTVVPLVPLVQVTHTATQNGSWSAPETWGGSLPYNGSRVRVPAGLTVTVDQCVFDTPFWIRVDDGGVLRHAPSVDTCLSVETLAIIHGGAYQMGTVAEPITASARLIYKVLNGQPISHSYDPFGLSRGLIAEGHVTMVGQPKTPWGAVTTIPLVGSLTIDLTEAPTGWKPGDTLVFTSSNFDEEETFQLVNQAGSTISLNKPIARARAFPAGCPGRCQLELANLTRNVQVLTAPDGAGSATQQGHTMLMHGGGHHFAHVQFIDLGRTTIKPVTDPLVGEDGMRIASTMPLCGVVTENIRGRYPLHFHMAGPESAPSIVRGVVVMVQRNRGFKGGIINHSSNVSVRDSVTFNPDGAHLVTEEGNEVGDFSYNLTIHSQGSNFALDVLADDDCANKNYPLIAARRRLDAWHEGVGCWLNGGGVDVLYNRFSQHSSQGCYGIWSRPLDFRRTNTFTVRFPAALLKDPSWANGQQYVDIDQVPFTIVGNTSVGHSEDRWAEKTGFELKYSKLTQDYPKQPRGILKGNTAWNVRKCVVATYVGFVAVSDMLCIQGNKLNLRAAATAIAMLAQGGNHHTYANIEIIGFQEAIRKSTTDTSSNVTWNGKAVP